MHVHGLTLLAFLLMEVITLHLPLLLPWHLRTVHVRARTRRRRDRGRMKDRGGVGEVMVINHDLHPTPPPPPPPSLYVLTFHQRLRLSPPSVAPRDLAWTLLPVSDLYPPPVRVCVCVCVCVCVSPTNSLFLCSQC